MNAPKLHAARTMREMAESARNAMDKLENGKDPAAWQDMCIGYRAILLGLLGAFETSATYVEAYEEAIEGTLDAFDNIREEERREH